MKLLCVTWNCVSNEFRYTEHEVDESPARYKLRKRYFRDYINKSDLLKLTGFAHSEVWCLPEDINKAKQAFIDWRQSALEGSQRVVRALAETVAAMTAALHVDATRQEAL